MSSGDILTVIALAGVTLSAIYCASLLISWRSGAAADLKARVNLRALYRTPIYHTKKLLATRPARPADRAD
jgi:hypothetical protein